MLEPRFLLSAASEQWNEVAVLTVPGAEYPYYGLEEVSISGDTAIVGAPYRDGAHEDSGAAYVFQDTGSGWTQVAELTASDAAEEATWGDLFGRCVSISGNTAIVGIERGPRQGAAYIFQDTGSGWTEVAKLTHPDPLEPNWNYYFGRHVSISGNTAIVAHELDFAGFEGDQGNRGRAFIFRDTGSGWTHVAELTASDEPYGFGQPLKLSVSISGDTAIVGAPRQEVANDYWGGAYLFRDTGSGWTQVAKLTPEGGPLGYWLSISGDTAIVSVSDKTGVNYTAGRVFRDTGSGWAQVAELRPSGGEIVKRVAISGDTAILGVMEPDPYRYVSAYIFRDTGSGWAEVAKLSPSDPADVEQFGASVSISGDTAIVLAREKAYIFSLCRGDLAADSLAYEEGPKVEDDVLELEVSAPEIDQTQDVTVSLYWSQESIAGLSQEDLRARFPDLQAHSALRLPGDEVRRALDDSGQGVLEIPIGRSFEVIDDGVARTVRLADPPGAGFRYLVAQVDSAGGTKFGGDLEEPDERNNFTQIDVQPDISAGDLDWDFTSGGLDVHFTVKNRAFVGVPFVARPEPVVLEVLWDGQSRATVEESYPLDLDEAEMHILPTDFEPPLAVTEAVVVRFDSEDNLTEVYEGNNTASKPLARLEPDVEFVVESMKSDISGEKSPMRKIPYVVKLLVKNNAAVPLNFELSYREEPVDPVDWPWDARVRDKYTLTDPQDATTGDLPQRSFDGASDESHWQRVEALQQEPVYLGALDGQYFFNRTWNWIRPLSKEAPSTVDLFNTLLGDLTAAFTAQQINQGLIQTLGELGGLVTRIHDVGGVLVEFTKEFAQAAAPQPVPKTLDQQSIKYPYEVTPVAKSRTVTQTGVGDVAITVPLMNRWHLSVARSLTEIANHHLGAVKQVLTSIDPKQALANAMVLEPLFESVKIVVDKLPQIVEHYEKALDPPDPNFRELVPVEPMPEGDSAGFWQRQLDLHRAINAWSSAAAVSEDRLLGAEAEGEAFWMSQHLIRISELNDLMARAYSEVVAAEQWKVSWLDATIPSDDPQLTPEQQAARILARLPELGFAEDEVELVEGLMEAIASSDLDDDPATLLKLTTFQSALAVESAGSRLLRAVELRVGELGSEVSPVADADLNALDAGRTSIDDKLQLRFGSAELLEEIETFIGDVRSLLLETNNADALRENLEFGYGALFVFQQSAMSPRALAGLITEMAEGGEIAQPVAETLNSALMEIDSVLASGGFDQAASRMADLGPLADELAEQGLDATVVSGIKGCAELATELAVIEPSETSQASLQAVIRGHESPLPVRPQTEADSPPDGLAWMDEWNSFWVEVWGSTPDADDAGITCFSVDVTYNTDYFTAVKVEYNAEFTGETPDFNDAGGVVDGIRATTLQIDLGDDKPVLLARVLFEVTDTDLGVPHNGVSQHVTPVDDLGIDLIDAEVELDWQGAAAVEIRPPANPELWPVMYDVDDDGQVGFGDLAFFATAFQQNVGDPGADFAWACDFDHSERVDVGDLAFFAENFQGTPGSPMVYPGNFPADWQTGTQQAADMQELAAAQSLRAADRESLHDSALEADTESLEADGNRARLLSDVLSYACCVLDSDRMAAASTSSSDTKDVAEAVDVLIAQGYW